MSEASGPALPSPVAIPPGLAATLVLVRHGESEDLAAGRFQGQRQSPLSELGRRQAALAGNRLAEPSSPPHLPVPAGDPVSIVHSPLRRAVETAAAVRAAFVAAGRPAPPLRVEPDLLEVGQGEWEGLLQGEVEARYPETIAGWRREPTVVHAPGGESLAEADARARAALDRVVAELAAAPRDSAADATAPGGRTASRPGSATTAGSPPSAAPPDAAVPSFYGPHAGPWTILVGHDGIFKVVLLALLGLPLERFWSFTQATAGIAVIDLRNGRAVVRAWNRTEHLAALEAEADDAERLSEELAADRNQRGAL